MSDPKPNIEILSTSSLHLATLLGSLGAQPVQIVKGAERNPRGDPIVKWQYRLDPQAEEALRLWNNTSKPTKSWDQMTHDERHQAIWLAKAFAQNLRHFIAHVKAVDA